MFSKFITKININKILGLTLALILIPALILTFLSNTNNFQTATKSKPANAAGPNTGDLIIGTKDTANAVELSVCVKATPGPFRLSQVSNWFSFNPSVLTPTPSTFLEKGQYGNTAVGLNGYSPIKWQEVNGTLNTTTVPNSDTYTMSLAYGGDGVTPNLAGLFMNTTTPELYGRVSFAKIPNATGSTAITMVKNQFFTIENGVALSQQVVNVSGDCRNSVCPANTTSTNGYIAPNPCTSTCTSGNYLDITTSTCKICPANSYCTTGTTTPTACPANSSSPVGSTLLTQCVAACTNGATNPSTCNQCPSGQYLNSSTCTPCPVGSYCPTPQPCATATCTPPTCPTGQTSPAGSTAASACYTPTCTNGATNPSTCNQCPSGQYLNSSTCTPCPVGSYCPTPQPCATATCTPPTCPTGQTSPAGSTAASACYTPTCTNGATNPSTCNQCPSGQYLNSSTCTPCPVGSYCPTPQPCATATCTPPTCPTGQTSPAGSTAASACYTPTCTNGATNPSTCNQCPSGQYLNSSTCTPCPVGSYCPTPQPCATATCTPPTCPTGQTSPAGSTAASACYTPTCTNGATNPSTCNQCPSGQYLNSSTCTPCPVGSYCPTPQPCATATCTPPTCPTGQTSPAGSTAASACYTPTCTNGATNPSTCNQCPSGQYLNSSTCTPCPVGSYCPTPQPCATATCTPPTCPTGQTSPAGSTAASACYTPTCTNGATNPSTCNQCPSGQYLNSSTCTPCPVGSYCPTPQPCATATCTPPTCPTGQTSPAGSTAASACYTPTCTNGATNPSTCNQCPSGQYLNSSTCTPCPVGSYCPTPQPCATATCTPPTCPTGQTSPAGSTAASACYTPTCTNGATNPSTCNQCPSGQYLNSSTCTPCPVGSYCPTPQPCATATCTPPTCPTGQTSPAGSTAASACYTPTCTNGATNPSTCNQCPSGQYLNSSTCTPCPINFVCIPLLCNPNCPPVIPTPCPAGTVAPAGSSSLASCIPSVTGGGVIIITNTSSSSSSVQSSSSQQKPIASIDPTFKSILRITDPYVCGYGSYGNVPDHSKFGVNSLFYDFYKVGSNVANYSYKLKMNADGEFFLPISKNTNNINEGNYKVVFYAYDNEGGKAQGEYSVSVKNDCGGQNIENDLNSMNSSKYDSIRTGGLSIASILVLLIIFASFGYSYQKSKTKKLIYESKNRDDC